MGKELRLDDQAPWKQRYRVPATWTQVAKANPSHGLAISNRSGVYQLYAWDVAKGAFSQLTDRPEGVVFGVIAPDGQYVYYLDDEHGNEIGHFVRVPFKGGIPEDITPELPLYAAWNFAICRTSDRIGFTLADQQGYHTYTISLGDQGALGTPQPLYETKSLALGPVLSSTGAIAVICSTERAGKPQFSLIALDTASGEPIGELWDGPESSLEPSTFSPLQGDTRLLGTTNCTGIKRPFIWDPRTGDRIDLIFDDIEGEIVPQDWSPDGQYILLCQFDQAVQQLYLYDCANGSLKRLQHPSGTFSGAYFGPAGEIYAHWQSSTHPPQLIALDRATGQQTRTVLSTEEVPSAHPWRSITFTSSDGQSIQGWLGLPDGDRPFPTILETHGGPSAVQTEVFSPSSQAWLDHGFAYLSINYRGSTTFGRKFEEQIWGDLGHWEVEDIVSAYDWLVEEGIANPDAVLLTGWSYGGYLTLQTLGRHPTPWAGGMAGIAIADWALQYEDSADTLKGYEAALFGGTPEEKPAQYAVSSPITYAHLVAAPVLIIQGRNDTRCPARPMELYEAKMKELGKDIEIHWFEAGHGSYVVEQSIAHQEHMLRFAYRILNL